MKRWILFIATILLFCSSVARTDALKDEVEARHKARVVLIDNYIKSLESFRPLAAKGDAAAQFSLGSIYVKGGGTQDYQEAVKWYRLAAKQGHTAAQYSLGRMYATGKGVTQDYQEAMKWYRLSAEQGNAIAQYNLGVMYAMGDDVIQDYVRAHMWFNLAASKGGRHAKDSQDRVAKEMTPSQIAEAQRTARDCENKNYKDCEY